LKEYKIPYTIAKSEKKVHKSLLIPQTKGGMAFDFTDKFKGKRNDKS
jgi:hypothetical protein